MADQPTNDKPEQSGRTVVVGIIAFIVGFVVLVYLIKSLVF